MPLMQVSRKIDYALRAVIHLANEEQSDRAGVCGGIDHFGFPLVDAIDLDDAIREVEAAGGRLIEKSEIGGGLPTAFVADPDGYRIQI